MPHQNAKQLADARRVRFLAATFRNILLVVSLLFIFAVVRTVILWAVCNAGMKTAATLEHQGLPMLNDLASVQENLALYRLDSYEYLFVQEPEKAGRAQAAEAVAVEIQAELKKIQALFPEGEGRQLAANLEEAVNELNLQFQKVRGLVDADFPAAMKSLDQDIPPRTERVNAAANALKEFGYAFSGRQASATFASFGSIKNTAVIFGIGNSLIAFCAFMFVLVAARRSRAQVAETLARLDERTQELQQTNGALEREVDKYQRAEKMLQESEKRFASAFELTPIGMALVSPQGHWLKVNRVICELVGYAEAELLTHTFQDITHPADLAADLDCVRRLLAGEIRSYHIEKRYLHARGHFVSVLLDVSLVRDTQGEPLYFIAQIQDITERKRLEAQLIQSQKLETVGKLAGGVAHEFNSILTAIIMQSELLLADLPAGSPLAENATEITKAANRAATLTRQLLAYGRKQFLQPEALDLNQVLSGMRGVLGQLMGGEKLTVNLVPSPGLRRVKADAGQIEQVIMNLAMNARDAMPNGGKLTLETANVTFDAESVGRFPELKPGDYVLLAVSDTGAGMSEAVKARAFEPFFSTKGVGQGTGLGLSTCYGIIKQSGGHISLYSEPGRGTTCKIYLPQAEPVAKLPSARLAAPGLPRGTETILLVEDDSALREMAATLLQRLGYEVRTAANGVEALSVQHAAGTGHIDLLFTDVVMPHMSGSELADRVRALYPQTKILFTSAYTEQSIIHQGVLAQGVALLQKPFTPSALAHKLREVLDGEGVP